ncbi:MAG: AAA family ATPase [bacterium]
MYLEFYGLDRKPFSKTPDPSMLYQSPLHAEALARMEQAVEDRELMLLTGEIGSGKTTLSRALIDRMPESVRPALIINPRLSPNQLLRTVARRLGEEEPRHYRSDLVEQIHELLFNCYESDILPLIIIDEAQVIPSRDTFEEIRLLTNFQLDDQNLMAIIMMGQPELKRRLRHPAYEALRQRIGLSYHLDDLEPQEVGGYIEYRLREAGCSRSLFTGEAVELIASLSRGIPRWINNLASAALLEGFGRETDTIGENIIEDVARDLGLMGNKEEGASGPAGKEQQPEDMAGEKAAGN